MASKHKLKSKTPTKKKRDEVGPLDTPPTKEQKPIKTNSTDKKRKVTINHDSGVKKSRRKSRGNGHFEQVNHDDEPKERDEELDVTPGEHRSNLQLLKDKDPEFYQYLQENDPELLDFDEGISSDEEEEGKNEKEKEEGDNQDDENDDVDDDDDDDDDDADSEIDEEPEFEMEFEDANVDARQKIPSKKRNKDLVSASVLRVKDVIALEKDLTSVKFNKKKSAFGKIVKYFRAGCHLADLSNVKSKKDIQKKGKNGSAKKSKKIKDDDELQEEKFLVDTDGSFGGLNIRFADGKAYQKLMSLCIERVAPILYEFFQKSSTKGKDSDNWDPCKSPHWSNLSRLVRAFIRNLLHLIDVINDAGTIRRALMSMQYLIPFCTQFNALRHFMLKKGAQYWSAEGLSQDTRVQAFLLIYDSCSKYPKVYLSEALKLLYNNYVRVFHKYNIRLIEISVFSMKCLVELFAIDFDLSYHFAFSKIRALSVTLRSALTSKGKEDLKNVYNWEYVNQLRLWNMVLSSFHGEDQLGLLIYPHVQICLGTLDLVPTAKNVGVRFVISNFLIDLMKQTGVFVPLSRQILMALNFSKLVQKGKSLKPVKALTKSIDWRCTLRVADANLEGPSFHEGVINHSVYLLGKYFSVLSRHPSFPEVTHPVTASLQKLTKEMKPSQYKTLLKDLSHSLQEHSTFVLNIRRNMAITPQQMDKDRGNSVSLMIEVPKSGKVPMDVFFSVEEKKWSKENAIHDQGYEKDQEKKKMKNEDEEEEEDDDGNESGDGHPDKKKTEKKKRVQVKKKSDVQKLVQTPFEDHDPLEDVVEDFSMSDDE